MNIKKIGTVNTTQLLWALQSNEQLWNMHRDRTVDPVSPHREIDDIWVRYAEYTEAKNPGPHESVWYPAANMLPVRDIIYSIMGFVKGERLGGVLITRIKAGRQCYPHTDKGWHADYYDKFAVQIQSSPGQKFCFEDGCLEPLPGDIYWFDNHHQHWVDNPTPYDRITMIVCIKPDKGA